MISLRHVTKRYTGGEAAVTDLSLEVAEAELCVLVGPSGGGKTTTLKMVNRLIEPTSGEILVDGQNVMAVDPVRLRRGIGYVMQQGGLFPHQRVADNVAAVPRLLGWPKAKVATRVAELLELVGLDPASYARRYPHELSGGERQRVGVARALGGDPPVLLMDEPFGAVDPIVRKRLQEEFLVLQQRLRKTVMFVTHDIEEAVAIGTRIAVFSRGGVLEQHGTPIEVLARPASDFVAEFVGSERGLHRLSVTKLSPEVLTKAVFVAATMAFRDANKLMHETGFRFALVDDGGSGEGQRASGWIARQPQTGALTGPVSAYRRDFSATVELGASLHDALASMLQHDDGFVAVTDGGRVLGVLTPDDLYAAMRRGVEHTAAPEGGGVPQEGGSAES